MKRMLDQKTIDELQALLSKIEVDGFEVNYKGTLSILNGGGILLFKIDGENDEIVIPEGLGALFDEEENPLIPLEDNAGKVLAVNEDEDGLEAIEVSGGTQLYKHTIEFDSDLDTGIEIEVISTSPSSYTTATKFNIAQNFITIKGQIEYDGNKSNVFSIYISVTNALFLISYRESSNGFDTCPIEQIVSDTVTPL